MWIKRQNGKVAKLEGKLESITQAGIQHKLQHKVASAHALFSLQKVDLGEAGIRWPPRKGFVTVLFDVVLKFLSKDVLIPNKTLWVAGRPHERFVVAFPERAIDRKGGLRRPKKHNSGIVLWG